MFTLNSVTFTYPGNPVPALKEVNFNAFEGEVILLAGANGSGKSTLIRTLTGIAPVHTGGNIDGQILYKNNPVSASGLHKLAGKVGIVLQDPEAQVTNLTVWEEVTFGPRNLCLPPSYVFAQAKNALTATGLLGKEEMEVFHLSGGQLQRLSIAALLAMEPEVLILDEPVANLDPHGVSAVVETLKTLKRHIKLIIIASHWLDPFLDLATRVLVMSEGKVILDVASELLSQYVEGLRELRVEIPHEFELRETLGEGLQSRFQVSIPQHEFGGEQALSLEDVVFSFNRNTTTTLCGITTSLLSGERVVLLGHNGAGKTTLGRLLAKLIDPTSGVRHSQYQHPSLLLQRPTLGFLGRTVNEELSWGLDLSDARAKELLTRFDLNQLQNRSPFSLSGGEQRRLALAVAVAIRPDLLILDEPSAGLDAMQVHALTEVLENELDHTTILYITHDSRIVSRCNRVIVLENGRIIADDSRLSLSPDILLGLDYHKVNPTLALAIERKVRPLPLHPSEIKVV